VNDLTVLDGDDPADVDVMPFDVQSQLAFELAAQLSEPASIIERYEITQRQLDKLLAHPGFRSMLEEARAVWAADTNVEGRVKLKAGFVVEDALLVLHNLIHNISQPATARIEAFKQAVAVAQMGPKKDQGPTAAKVEINITIPAGDDKPEEKIVIEAEPVEEEA